MKFASIPIAARQMYGTLLLPAAVVGLAGSLFAGQVKVGAIRWDAWVGPPNSVGMVVEQDLSPAQFHYRVPFYGQETGSNSIQARCTTQAVMDREIAYAKNAGLAYWAFVWYPSSSGLDLARNLYLASSHSNDVNFCLVIEAHNFPNNLPPAEIVSFMSRPNYQKVLGNRPILYFLGATGMQKADVDNLRALAIQAGLGTPYIVMLRTDSNYEILATLGLDAFGTYATTTVGKGAAYKTLVATDIDQWNLIKGMGYKMVPNVTSGWDKRPRAVTPVFFDLDPGTYSTQWVVMPTPPELASHVQDAISWVQKYPATADAGTALIYAWNEFDEGGWICPTLCAGDERLRALRAVLSGK